MLDAWCSEDRVGKPGKRRAGKRRASGERRAWSVERAGLYVNRESK